ncbi:carbohydrate ABC transporter permease [Geomicrobium sp. JCM 19039]|uniref:carbohydrate ABC transporter permease n=1 Tax=Geomicrobium sp. JCM 19039 TaxID=1460636 RepID=UPI00045F414A|nr:carbohydrate ABC transporter permease [Geomicrobium sp. JCM 19039]GAK13235.1 binding-protein-dependent transport systems inner membrane component [Geomicrobium sp. JCM 19039]
MNQRTAYKLGNVGLYACFIVITLFFLFPLLWTVSLSLKDSQSLFTVPPELIPSAWAFENYVHVIQNNNIFQYIANSGIIVFFTVIVTLLVAIPAAFALSRITFGYKRPLMITILMTQMISAVVISIPLYRILANYELLNQYWVLILVYVAVVLPLATWILKGHFDTLPPALDEAAIIDGCTRSQLISKIIVLAVCQALHP